MKRFTLRFGIMALLFSLCLFVPHYSTKGQTNQNAHSIALTWTAPSPLPVSYGIYRSTVSGGPYTRISNPLALTVGTTPTPVLSYNDASGVAGTKYFYVATSIDNLGVESIFSNEASAVAPSNPVPPTGLAAVAK